MFELGEGETAETTAEAVESRENETEAETATELMQPEVAPDQEADPEAETETEPEAEAEPEAEDESDESDEADAEGEADAAAAAPLAGEENGISPLPLASVVEAILFAAREALKPVQIARAVGRGTRQNQVRDAVAELNVHYLETGRAFEIAEISGRYQLMSRPEYAEQILRLYPKKAPGDKDRKERLTPAALDTLAIIAYKQPVMRSEIEHIRGVACGPMLKTLIERGTVREVGRRTDLVGKPAVFGTTERFLIEFGLGSLDELPLRNEFASFAGFKVEATDDRVVEITPTPQDKADPEAAETPDPAPESGEAEAAREIVIAEEEEAEDNEEAGEKTGS